MLLYLFLSILFWFAGAQLQWSELCLLTRHYNYRIQHAQYFSFLTALVMIVLTVYELMTFPVLSWLLSVMAAVLTAIVAEWVLAKVSPTHLAMSLTFRLIIICCWALASWQIGILYLSPFLFAGIFLRNSPFGVVHGKPLFLAYYSERTPMHSVVHPAPMTFPPRQSHITVTDHGIYPDTDEDLTDKVQALIDKVGSQGGGCLHFPRGKYHFNKHDKRQFLQINHSHITIEGETDEQGCLLTELINCGKTVEGSRNPWLSPFFITTGEALQPSNIFWGLDFRKPKGIHMESSSLSDPGSDGQILTPPFATRVTADAQRGDTHLQVEDSSRVGKYILLGLYNTTPEGELIKEILGVNTLREEWLTARRAGEEEAPSFQWLVEVKSIVDKHTLELCRPLLRDCPMKYEPAIFNVELLEDIHIRNLKLSSTWNGLFHHHGIPLYYSVPQAQQMDYGWNAINMKRAAHSTIENVEIKNFTNPIFVVDSREVEVSHLTIRGYDGHQGLKAYCHTCDCHFHHIDFHCHFADMMGCEGNAYANTFSSIRYLNPTFNPVDFDFHGFSEGPFSPPAFNLFERCEGFRYIKGAGAVFMQPACATDNTWRQCVLEGERHDTQLFYAMSYRVRSGLSKYVTAVGYALVMMLKHKQWSLPLAKTSFTDKLQDIDYMSIPRKQHDQFFPQCHVEQVQTTATVSLFCATNES